MFGTSVQAHQDRESCEIERAGGYPRPTQRYREHNIGIAVLTDQRGVLCECTT